MKNKKHDVTKTGSEGNFFSSIWARRAPFRKSLVSLRNKEGIINDLLTEDQIKVLHHYYHFRETNCAG